MTNSYCVKWCQVWLTGTWNEKPGKLPIIHQAPAYLGTMMIKFFSYYICNPWSLVAMPQLQKWPYGLASTSLLSPVCEGINCRKLWFCENLALMSYFMTFIAVVSRQYVLLIFRSGTKITHESLTNGLWHTCANAYFI